MPTRVESAESLLQAAYQDLGFADGFLLDATDDATCVADDTWLGKGDWLRLAKAVNAEKIFFVEDNPVIVFAQHDAKNPEELRDFFNRVWCMSRPQLLFLASPGELNVLDMTAPPVRITESVLAKPRVLDTVRKTSDILSKLGAYHRKQIESGKLFEEARFEKGKHRADGKLIDDLRRVREQLIDAGLRAEHVHALIGRSIFIRYLEDRGVLTRDFFYQVAGSQTNWVEILDTPPDETYIDPRMGELLYPRVLSNKDFTYALYEHLSGRFNGDMFPSDLEEKQVVESKHLNLLKNFLTGAADGEYKLFFFAYRFDVIPIELISSIYEEFYNKETGKKHNQGSHYTPSALVEYVLGQVLTPDCLIKSPRILDPACGSGIFLVEAFRRIVRYRVKQQGQRLGWGELQQILFNQIAGIDINGEAIRVAAFSLYLALLHYQEPPDILQHPRLPNLVYQHRQERDKSQHFDILLAADAFGIEHAISDSDTMCRFGSNCVDVVVGNPPWGAFPRKAENSSEPQGYMIDWCEARSCAVGDNEFSQAFIHRTVDALREGGVAGLLVSSGVLFKSNKNSRIFRKQWLSAVKLIAITNFAHVRRVFFSGSDRGSHAIAPFASIVFCKQALVDTDHQFQYWCAKRTALAAKLRSAVLSKADLKLLSQYHALNNDDVWKIYWWGSHRDEALIRALKANTLLKDVIFDHRKLIVSYGQGFTPGKLRSASEELMQYPQLPVGSFQRYGCINKDAFTSAPTDVHRFGQYKVYDGLRLLVERGINEDGRIIARLESLPFCFSNSINGIRVDDSAEDAAKIVLAILWSALARYYFFLTSGSWGMWHDEIHENALLNLPICFPANKALMNKIIAIVDELRTWDTSSFDLGGYNEARILAKERELDEAVFDLYNLSSAERDLVRDMCEVGLDLFYRHAKSNAVKPVTVDKSIGNCGRAADLPAERTTKDGIEAYLSVFLQTWNRELGPEGEFRWQIVCPGHNSPMLAVILSTQFKDSPLPIPNQSDNQTWEDILRRMDTSSLQPYWSRRVYVDGLVRIVTDTDIVIIKRNERRLWTRSMAREDAEATLLQAMYLQGSEVCG